MRAKAEVDAGVCGFRATILAESTDGQFVTFDIATDCEKNQGLAAKLRDLGPIDAFQEISPAAEGRVMGTARATLKGCCAACAIPVGAFKAMQVAAGLALAKDVAITITKE
jgi:hypothetical protein